MHMLSRWRSSVLVAVLMLGTLVMVAGDSVHAAGFTSGVAYVATGENFPDALGAGPAAATDTGPVLLVRKDSIPGPTVSELRRLKPDRIVIVGGTAVISAAVEADLGAFAPVVDRIAGADRYATAAELSKRTFPVAGGPVPPSSGCPGIQAALDSLSDQSGPVQLEAGVYVCTEPIVIDRDGATLHGVGPASVIKLADGANTPVLIIGDDTPTPATTAGHIRVADLFIDANREHQTVECDPDCATNPLRNNGITIRRAEDVTVENVTVRGARSGGIVVELESRRIHVNRVRLVDNHLDGLAGYETEDSLFTGLVLSDNKAAGLSLDRGFDNNILADIVITDSGTSGIFLRDGSSNIFDGLRIVNSEENGVFLAQLTAAEDPDMPAPTGNTFSSITITGSSDWGFFQADAAVTDTLLDSAQFINNALGCFDDQPGGEIIQGDIVCRP